MLWNVLLMIVWAALTNDFSPLNLAWGFLIGLIALAFLSNRGLGSRNYTRRFARTIEFLGFYVLEVFLANLRMAKDVLTPTLRFQPAIVAVPLAVGTETEAEIALLANLIALTPGTLTVDISEDRRILYVHTIDLPNGDTEAFVAKIKDDFERRVLEVLH